MPGPLTSVDDQSVMLLRTYDDRNSSLLHSQPGQSSMPQPEGGSGTHGPATHRLSLDCPQYPESDQPPVTLSGDLNAGSSGSFQEARRGSRNSQTVYANQGYLSFGTHFPSPPESLIQGGRFIKADYMAEIEEIIRKQQMAQQNARNYLSPSGSSEASVAKSRREAVLKQAVVLASMMFDGGTSLSTEQNVLPTSNGDAHSHIDWMSPSGQQSVPVTDFLTNEAPTCSPGSEGAQAMPSRIMSTAKKPLNFVTRATLETMGADEAEEMEITAQSEVSGMNGANEDASHAA